MGDGGLDRTTGMGRGKVFPAAHARSLLNPARRLVQSPGRTVAGMRLAPGARVLEVGCGPGFFSPYIADAVEHGSLVLCDLQGPMLHLARTRLNAHPNVVYAQGDAISLPFASDRFDTVFLATVLGEVPDPGACVDEIRRVLRPRGALVVSETRRDSDFIALRRLRGLVEAHDFGFVDRRGIRWQYTATFRAQ